MRTLNLSVFDPIRELRGLEFRNYKQFVMLLRVPLFLVATSQYSHGESSPRLVSYRVIPLEKQTYCIIGQSKPLFERAGKPHAWLYVDHRQRAIHLRLLSAIAFDLGLTVAQPIRTKPSLDNATSQTVAFPRPVLRCVPFDASFPGFTLKSRLSPSFQPQKC